MRSLLTSVIAVGLSASVLGCSGNSGNSGESDRPAASSSTGPTATESPATPHTPGVAPTGGTDIDPDDLPAETVRAAKDGGDLYFESWTTALSDPEAIDPTDDPTVTGVTDAALEELINTLAEYRENGWRMEGRARVVSSRVLDATKNPDVVRVVACVDNSEVRLVDSEGTEVPNSRQPNPRTRNILTLVPDGTAWVVAAQRPATQPNC